MAIQANRSVPPSNSADPPRNGRLDDEQSRGPESTLRKLGDLLRRAEQQCEDATASIAPEVRPAQTACERYSRALSNWPRDAQPSYEQLARLLCEAHHLKAAISKAIVQAEAAAELAATAVGDPDDDTRLDRVA